jgi:NADH-quinone oxidoreductase E subunit
MDKLAVTGVGKGLAVEESVLSEESRAEILRIREEYPDARSALLPALYLAQADYGGWLPEAAFDEVAEVMALPPAFVASVASFYTQLNREPVGRHHVQVCTNISCSLAGGRRLLEYISQQLGLEPGETSADGSFSLVEVECLGSCDTGPMMQVSHCSPGSPGSQGSQGSRDCRDTYYENLSEARIDEILANLANEENDA